MLGIIDSIVQLSLEKNLTAGYSFIKKSLDDKLRKLKLPIHYIKPYDLIYSKDLLKNYFYCEDDPVIPIYYFRDEVKDYLNFVFNNEKLFKSINDKKMIYLGQKLNFIDTISQLFKLFILKIRFRISY